MKYLALCVAMICITAIVIVLLTVCKVEPVNLGIAAVAILLCIQFLGDD